MAIRLVGPKFTVATALCAPLPPQTQVRLGQCAHLDTTPPERRIPVRRGGGVKWSLPKPRLVGRVAPRAPRTEKKRGNFERIRIAPGARGSTRPAFLRGVPFRATGPQDAPLNACLPAATALFSDGSTVNARWFADVETVRAGTIRRCHTQAPMRKSVKMFFASRRRIQPSVLLSARFLLGSLLACLGSNAAWPDSASATVQDKRNHWAFKPPVRPPVPNGKNRKWTRNPIDHFVVARLEKEGLKPSPDADRATLIRRLNLDLTGLPPTPKEVDEFVRDKSPEACDTLVERLLASPHYGERWGRHWLDVARYADSNGYEKDASRSIWPYRDYVIQAFNRDLPFDQFTIEPLAGDLLPHPTLDQRVATGFRRNSMLNQEGGIEPEQFRTEAMIDRMDAIGK